MLNLCSLTKVKLFFLVLVYVFNFDLFEFSAAILEKGLFNLILVVPGSNPRLLVASSQLVCLPLAGILKLTVLKFI